MKTTDLAAGQPAPPDPARQFEWTPAEKLVAHRNMHVMFASDTIEAAATPCPLPYVPQLATLTYALPDGMQDLDGYFTRTHATGLLVLKNGQIALERYAGGNTETTLWASRSVAKSFVSTLIGAALHDGAIRSLDDRVADYVPELAGTLYERVTLRQNLQMTSGQPHDNEFPSILALHQCLVNRERHGLLRALKRFAAPGTPWHPPGERFVYHSADVIVSGLVLERATGCRPARYLQDKIWKPFGMEQPAYWNLDGPGGTTFANSGISACLRDWARLGLFMLHEGRLPQGTQVLPDGWIVEATTPSAASLHAGNPYGFNWWLVQADSDAPPGQAPYSARGSAGQRIFIDPARQLVIAKWATWDNPPMAPSGKTALAEDDILFTAIARQLSG